MSALPDPQQLAAATEAFHQAEDAARFTTVPVSPLVLEDTVNSANALLHLFASALSWEMYMADTHKARKESTVCGFTSLEADMRDKLAALL